MKTGVIGCGNMATAIIGGLIAGGFAAREDITASDRSDEQRRKLAAKFGVTTKADNKKCVENAEIVLCIDHHISNTHYAKNLFWNILIKYLSLCKIRL